MPLQVKNAVRPLPKEGESLNPRALKPDYKVNPETGCWEWAKHRNRKNYGQSRFPEFATQWAHRAYYEAANGPIPEGYVIDHLCRNPPCVNPKHLEAVPQATNIHRGAGAKLTMEIAREVRRRTIEGQSAGQIKDELGVSIQNVWWITEDRAWREDPTGPRNPVRPIRNCAHCGKPITEGMRTRKFCERPCYIQANYELKLQRERERRAVERKAA